LKVCEPPASPEYEAGLAQAACAPPSSWHAYEPPLPPLKLKLAVALLLQLSGEEVIVGEVSTVSEALAEDESNDR
jgi:hypothetical protein